LNKAEVLARLEARYSRIASSTWAHDRATKQAVLRTLEALDNPCSYYVVLSEDERERVRTEWLALATRMGVQAVEPRAPRKPPTLPAAVQEFFGDAEALPHRPRASDDCQKGMHATGWEQAQHLRYVELNPPAHEHWLAFDCDHTEAERWKQAGLPEPSFVTITPTTGRHHVVYRLRTPVCRSERGRTRPRAYLRAVREALRAALRGDVGYAGVLTKNPLHSDWQVRRPVEMPSYSLADLAATIDLRQATSTRDGKRAAMPSINLAEVGVGGRNYALFNALRRWVRLDVGNLDNLLAYAENCNATFQEPLGFNEVNDTVRSITKYTLDRRRPSSSRAAFCEKQAARGRLGGRPRTTGDSQPWKMEGISRTTWYERRKGAAAGAAS